MPEVILTCPACGSASVQLMTSYSPWFTQAFHVLCIDCQMQGPIACSQREEDAIDIQDLECLAGSTGFEAAAIAAWNSLPRALRWTNESPKVAGQYWQRKIGYPQSATIASIDDFGSGMRCKSTWGDRTIEKWSEFEWAGPIALPVE